MKTKLTWSIHRFRMNNGLRNILVAALCLATASIEAVVPSSAGQNEVSGISFGVPPCPVDSSDEERTHTVE